MEYISLALTMMLFTNIVLSKLLGVYPPLAMGKKAKNVIALGLTITVVLTLSAVVNFAMKLLLNGIDLAFLNVLSYVLVTATLVQFSELLIKRLLPKIHGLLAPYMPLLTVNAIILVIGLNISRVEYNFLELALTALFSGLGYVLVTILFSFIQERLDNNIYMPKSVKGIAISLITLGFMVMAFSGLKGLM